ncbi:uncharacterized protein LOC116805883 [Drosophila grimshawi]|uniref:uncharacterized protein LOC116805883 n=1 Tax=Drosophila grimshawi TaxID=7222 RepID=UPI0013EF1FE9|nr:uncharacterized protein LOC116805883 [Drosophila grimshawi]
MCFLGLRVLKANVHILSLLVLFCNVVDLVITIKNLDECKGTAKIWLIVSILLNTLLNFGISLGSYGAVIMKTLYLKLYAVTLMGFMISKLVLAQAVRYLDDAHYNLLVGNWYYLVTTFSVLCLIFVVSLLFKMRERRDINSDG